MNILNFVFISHEMYHFLILLFEMECADMCDLMLNKNHEIFLTLTKKKYFSRFS